MSRKQKHWIERRAEAASLLARKCQHMVFELEGMVFVGKSEMMKRIIAAAEAAEELAWDLEIDALDAKRREELGR